MYQLNSIESQRIAASIATEATRQTHIANAAAGERMLHGQALSNSSEKKVDSATFLLYKQMDSSSAVAISADNTAQGYQAQNMAGERGLVLSHLANTAQAIAMSSDTVKFAAANSSTVAMGLMATIGRMETQAARDRVRMETQAARDRVSRQEVEKMREDIRLLQG